MMITSPSFTYTRPADTTAYSIGDLMANSTTAGSVVALSWSLGSYHINAPFTIKRITIQKSTTTITLYTVRVHLYTAAPTVTNGDNGAFSSTGSANYLGYIDIDATTNPGAKFSDGCVGLGAFAAGSEINAKLPAGSTLYGLIEAKAAYVPGNAEVFTVTLDLIEYSPSS
jgi:hypothetical protein